MKYIIEKSDLFINNKLHPEGSEIDLTKEQTKGLEEYLIQCHSALDAESKVTEGHPEPCPELVSGSAIISGSPEGSETNIEKKSKIKGNKK